MLNKIKKWFSKNEDEFDIQPQLPKEEEDKFVLKVDGIKVANLACKDGKWYFRYTDEFKKHSDEYNLIVGFSDLDKVYESEELWPFFQIRIPGLKQPSVRKIIQEENIDKNNEAELLKRFGRKSIANPYQLIVT